jgi:hypothetical protein
MRTRIFFPQEILDIWVADDSVDFAGDELSLKSQGRKYRTVEAVRVLVEVTGGGDPNELVGKVKSRAFLAELGAEVLEGSMVIGDNAYDVVQGFAAEPIGAFEEFKAAHPTVTARSDEEILAGLAG